MAYYPFYKELQDASLRMPKGNFGLWYNKFIPLSETFKASDENGRDTTPVEYYFTRYGQMKSKYVTELLKQKHDDQEKYCQSFPKESYEVINISAKLVSPLVTGIGETHPHEISMVFDHNMGIPYIPASGVKGIVRFAHTIALWHEGTFNDFITTDAKTGLEYFDDDNCLPVYSIFGNQKQRGKVIFLDAYTENVPDLHIDIMNPHYTPYYSDGKPPADYHNPTPIKFLTVAQGTTFIFRAIVKKDKDNDMLQKVRSALVQALTEEGVGAKTAVGYGRFAIAEIKQVAENDKKERAAKEEPTMLNKCCFQFQTVKPNEAGKIGPLIDKALQSLTSDEEKKEFAKYVKEFMGKEFKKSKAKEKLKAYLL
jgi:CRISPR-associated protein Cmr6